MNKTELQLCYQETFWRDISRDYKRRELIDALTSGIPIDDDGAGGMDVVRNQNAEWIKKYYEQARYQLSCDMICAHCPAGVVADCYLSYKKSYVE